MGLRHKILLYEPIHSEGLRFLEKKCDVIYANSLEEDCLIKMVTDVDGIIIRANGRVSKGILESASRLKVVGRHGVGLDNINLKVAKERGVIVVYTPIANVQSVVEHFIGLAITLTRKIKLAYHALQSGYWNARYELIGMELFGKTVGILGFGRIGQHTARFCRKCFEMPVLYHDIVDYPDVEKELTAQRVTIEYLFEESDLISVNLPLSSETRGIVNANLLKRMKPTAFLVNMARGPVWKEADVIQALKNQWIAGVASDVFEVEPVLLDNPLFEMENFVGTPHMAAHTEESLIRMSMVARDILRVLEGQKPEFPVPSHPHRFQI